MVFIVIIAVYAHRMDAIDRGVATEPDEPRA